MNTERKRLVLESWQSLADHHDRVATAFYDRLFEIDPHGRALFAHTNMEAQRMKIVAMLGEIVRNLDQPDALIPSVGALGRRHVGYGVQDADYDMVREALLGAIAAALGDAFTREVRSAWEAAYALTASVMKRAGKPSQTGVADSSA